MKDKTNKAKQRCMCVIVLHDRAKKNKKKRVEGHKRGRRKHGKMKIV